MANQHDLQILEMLIETWQDIAARARTRAEQAEAEQGQPPADYWYGIAFALELAATQLLTGMGGLLRPAAIQSGDAVLSEPPEKLFETVDAMQAITAGLERIHEEPSEDRSQRLLRAVRSHPGQWLKRVEIAHLLGNKALSSGDVVLLQRLADEGYIEARRVPTTAPSGSRWEYRAVPQT